MFIFSFIKQVLGDFQFGGKKKHPKAINKAAGIESNVSHELNFCRFSLDLSTLCEMSQPKSISSFGFICCQDISISLCTSSELIGMSKRVKPKQEKHKLYATDSDKSSHHVQRKYLQRAIEQISVVTSAVRAGFCYRFFFSLSLSFSLFHCAYGRCHCISISRVYREVNDVQIGFV